MNISSYLKPKTNIYTGIHDQVETTIINYEYDQTNFEVLSDFDFKKPIKHYIQVIGLADIKKISQIKEQFQIDALIIEDVFNVNQRNKIEVKDNYLFGAFNLMFVSQGVIKEDYMSIILTKDTVISFHETKPIYLDPIKTLIKDYHELRERSIDFLFFQILDIITDSHLDIYDMLEEQINTFEEQILETKLIEQDDFYQVRKHMLELKNNVTPVLEQLDRALSKKLHIFNEANLSYYDDLKDHLQRLDVRLNVSREQMHHLLDLHMNNQSTKMNKIMTTLTIFSAIFIPLSFLTGFFGMNFIYFGLLEYEFAVLMFGLVCLTLAIGMVLFFKKKKWF